jgi:hypothetical protein
LFRWSLTSLSEVAKFDEYFDHSTAGQDVDRVAPSVFHSFAQGVKVDENGRIGVQRGDGPGEYLINKVEVPAIQEAAVTLGCPLALFGREAITQLHAYVLNRYENLDCK